MTPSSFRQGVGSGVPPTDPAPGFEPAPDAPVNGLLAWARSRLVGLEASNAAHEARELLEWACDAPSTWLIRESVDEDARRRFIDAVLAREAHTPLHVITSRMYFRTLTLHARPGVFACRPETEVVAGVAIDEAKLLARTKGHPRVVDLCTGSGAIACAIAVEVPESIVDAVEIDEDAFALAQLNAQTLAPGNIRVIHADATARDTLADLDARVDVVVSNPPYVPLSEAPTQAEAMMDPALALYGGGADGMDIPRRIIERARGLLREGGLLVVEHSPSQSALMRQAAVDAGFVEVSTGADLSGHERMLIARTLVSR